MNTMHWLQTSVGPVGWASIKREVEQRGGSRLNSKTMMAGQRDNRHAFAGVAGEMAVRILLPTLIYCEGNRNFDFRSKTNERFEVKTRSGSTLPQPHFDIRVPEYSFNAQECDAYIFCHAVWDGPVISQVFITGWLRKEEFLKIARRSKVENAQTQASGFDQRAGGNDMLFARVDQLRPIKELP